MVTVNRALSVQRAVGKMARNSQELDRLPTTSKQSPPHVISGPLTPDEAKALVTSKITVPTVFTGMLSAWTEALTWTPQKLGTLLSNVETQFKIYPKCTPHGDVSGGGTVFENQCIYVTATYRHLHQWLEVDSSGKGKNTLKEALLKDGKDERPISKQAKLEQPTSIDTENPLFAYPRGSYWVYADYKYMSQLCGNLPGMLDAVDWGVFGFGGRNGNDSSLWCGSEGSFTPCHFDTYGCNLVAQLYGHKKWQLFPPSESHRMYPTRLPFEESSVFSQVNPAAPNFELHPKFANVECYEITLEPGQVLYVPPQWWHYVECVTPAISVNTWIEMDQDKEERVKETLVRALVCSLKRSEALESEVDMPTSSWLNPGELVAMAMDQLADSGAPPSTQDYYLSRKSRTQLNDLLVNCASDKRVVSAMFEALMERSQWSV